MSSLLAKTAAGQQEIRARTLALTRPARTLLVLADGTRSGEALLGMVQGATAADLEHLVASGLIEHAAAAAPSPRRSAEPARTAPTLAEPEPQQPASDLGYQELYDSLNALCREQLGLIKGLRFSLDIEKADGIDALRDVARRFVGEVQKVKGDSAAQMSRRALGMTN